MPPEPDFQPEPTIGPLLQTAILCEKVLEERDGVKSAIRIIDQINRAAWGVTPPAMMEPFPYSIAMLLRLKAGAARGTYRIDVRIMKPSNEVAGTMSHPVYFPGPDDAGTDVVVNMQLQFDEAGTWWFEILVEDKRWMRVPLRIVYLPTKQPTGPGGPGGPS